jgi:hypothetical protein
MRVFHAGGLANTLSHSTCADNVCEYSCLQTSLTVLALSQGNYTNGGPSNRACLVDACVCCCHLFDVAMNLLNSNVFAICALV